MPRKETEDKPFLGSHFTLTVDGQEVGFFTSATGLSLELAVTEQKQISAASKQVVLQRIPGRPTYGEIVLKRGYSTDTALFEWFNGVVKAAEPVTRTTASIAMYDRTATLLATFNFDQCWPSKLTASDLSADSDDVVVEELTLQVEQLDWAS